MIAPLSDPWWHALLTALVLSCAVVASSHVVLHKRDVRSAIGWVGLIWLVPWLGALLYLLLGINRIQRRAIMLRREPGKRSEPPLALPQQGEQERIEVSCLHLEDLTVAIGNVTKKRLTSGNRFVPLINGDAAYPAMLAAIDRAEHSIAMSTYIFETTGVGAKFVDALVRAHERGVQVRVLIDDIGVRYARPRADRVLRKRHVPTALFMPARSLLRAPYFNLRNHRKILIVDGKVGFTGGMNIRESHVIADPHGQPTRDLHFQVGGPVVAHLAEVFASDWDFTTREKLTGQLWFPELAPTGSTLARGIADGPDEAFERVSWTLQAALACAHRSVTIMTPYFLPDPVIHSALSTAALRGVEVNVVLPGDNNLRLVQWAMWRQLEEVLRHGVRVWLTPPPFDHTKLMLVDSEWVLLGSANWDTRSLRLNFELDLECYDQDLCASLTAHVSSRLSLARELTFHELRSRPLAWRVRDGFARLLMPYL
ncbi:MAG TPA: phospholipase D-like domain-containing protein [Polyangiales bacterium]|nr:phospholipase D-like domain-containing protein [Polyangiales bacterium]